MRPKTVMFSEAEERVLTGYALGRTKQEMSEATGLTYHTIKSHTRRMVMRHGLNTKKGSTSALVDFAYRRGVLSGLLPQDWEHRPLTEQQQRILKLIARGMNEEQIAATLFVSVNTVHTTITKRLLPWLGAVHRPHAVALGWELNYLDQFTNPDHIFEVA